MGSHHKIIIAGGRRFRDFELLRAVLNAKFKDVHNLAVISGCCPTGADALGERYAAVIEAPVVKFPADWATYGRAAGPIRNRAMAEYADEAIVFWDGKSFGSASMIREMKRVDKPCTVVMYEEHA